MRCPRREVIAAGEGVEPMQREADMGDLLVADLLLDGGAFLVARSPEPRSEAHRVVEVCTLEPDPQRSDEVDRCGREGHALPEPVADREVAIGMAELMSAPTGRKCFGVALHSAQAVDEHVTEQRVGSATTACPG